MFHKPSSIFVRVKAREILFDGLPIDCTGKDFGSKVICSVLKQRNDVFIPTGPEQYLFSIFGFVRTYIYMPVCSYSYIIQCSMYDNKNMKTLKYLIVVFGDTKEFHYINKSCSAKRGLLYRSNNFFIVSEDLDLHFFFLMESYIYIFYLLINTVQYSL